MGSDLPKIVHVFWAGSEPPFYAERCIEQCRRLNPGYEVRFHDESALDPVYAELYERCPTWSDRSDLIRYSVLARDGGWWLDTDQWLFRPLADAERAWGIDGATMFLPALTDTKHMPRVGGAVLAVGPDWPGWDAFRDMVLGTEPGEFGALGPELLTQTLRRHREWFTVARRAWWYGPGIAEAGKLFPVAAAGRLDVFRRLLPDTAGQLPFGMHLWAHKHAGKIAEPGGAPPTAFVPERPNVHRLPFIDKALAGVETGLRALGYETERYPAKSNALERSDSLPAVCAAWNGTAGSSGKAMAAAARYGAVRLYLEHGFWRRTEYLQCDTAGTQHRASWAGQLTEPAPPEGAERLRVFYPDRVTPVRARRDGYILVIGQVPNDTQLADSEVKAPVKLQRVVKRLGRLPAPVFFRPHPRCRDTSRAPHKLILRTLDGHDATTEAAEYRRHRSGAGLAEALAGARFVITINSTAGNEALAAGVPVLAFGPALYSTAGVAHTTTVKTLQQDVGDMLDGWCPDPAAVENYLRWLAARQWTAEELARPETLRTIGVPDPEGIG